MLGMTGLADATLLASAMMDRPREVSPDFLVLRLPDLPGFAVLVGRSLIYFDGGGFGGKVSARDRRCRRSIAGASLPLTPALSRRERVRLWHPAAVRKILAQSSGRIFLVGSIFVLKPVVPLYPGQLNFAAAVVFVLHAGEFAREGAQAFPAFVAFQLVEGDERWKRLRALTRELARMQ